jgi:purine-binding chemotaxis protein CheW
MDINDLIKSQEHLRQAIDSGLSEGQGDASAGGDGQVIQLVSFTLDDVEYGIDILQVHEILRIPEMTRLPNTPKFIRGVINLRGNVIPVVDVRERFGFRKTATTDESRIIVIESEGKQIGMFVDNVSQVIRINMNHIDPPSDLIEGVSEDFISGIGRLAGSLIVILALKNILFETSDKESSRLS